MKVIDITDEGFPVRDYEIIPNSMYGVSMVPTPGNNIVAFHLIKGEYDMETVLRYESLCERLKQSEEWRQ